MNVTTYEQIQKDPVLFDKVAARVYYATGKQTDPHFTALWAEVSATDKEKSGAIGMAAIAAIIDDYTTPGCSCEYCASGGERGHSKPLMCSRRWQALSPEEKNHISESCAD